MTRKSTHSGWVVSGRKCPRQRAVVFAEVQKRASRVDYCRSWPDCLIPTGECLRITICAMGEAIKKPHIPVGAVLSSPTYSAPVGRNIEISKNCSAITIGLLL